MKLGTIAAALVAVAAAVSAVPIGAEAAAFPTRPVTIVVGYPPGAGNDIIARILGQYFSESWKQPVIVENRAGASGVIGAGIVAHARPDGYTLLLMGSSHLIQAAMTKSPYEPVADFTPIGLAGTGALVLEVNPAVKATNVKELIALAKASPGALTFGSAGTGTSPQMAGELFSRMAGVQMLHVPYKGSAPAQSDLIGGQIQTMFQVTQSALPSVAANQVRAIAVTGSKRIPELPDVPTIAESGVPGYDLVIWWGVLGPKGLPDDVTGVINGTLRTAIADPDVAKRLRAAGVEPTSSSSQDMLATMRTDYARYSQLVKDAGIKSE
jgi:tripartite-type tricarboxylate transporter receptor subunit TctC